MNSVSLLTTFFSVSLSVSLSLSLSLALSQLWEVEGGAQLRNVEAHQAAILSCHVSPDGRLAATTSTDRTAKVTHTHTLTHTDTHTLTPGGW